MHCGPGVEVIVVVRVGVKVTVPVRLGNRVAVAVGVAVGGEPVGVVVGVEVLGGVGVRVGVSVGVLVGILQRQELSHPLPSIPFANPTQRSLHPSTQHDGSNEHTHALQAPPLPQLAPPCTTQQSPPAVGVLSGVCVLVGVRVTVGVRVGTMVPVTVGRT